MIDVRPFEQLGRFDTDCLAARYHFSFAGYRDPARSGVGPLLVWNDDTIQPAATGLAPAWATRRFPKAGRTAGLAVLASGRPGDEGALPIHQDAAILGATLAAGQSVTHELGARRQAYLVAASGRFQVNGVPAAARDGITVAGEERVTISALEETEILLADLP